MKRRLAKLLTILLTVSAISGAEVVSAAAAVAAPGRVMAAETDIPDAAAAAETAEEPAGDPVQEEPVIGDTDVPADPMADLEQQEEKKEEQAGETAAEGMTEEAAAEAATAEEAAVPAEEITEAEEAAEAVTEDSAAAETEAAVEELTEEELEELAASKIKKEGWYKVNGMSRYYYLTSAGTYTYAKNRWFETEKNMWHYFDSKGQSYHKKAAYINNKTKFTSASRFGGKKVTFGVGRVYFSKNGAALVNGVNTDKNGYVYRNGSWMFIYPSSNTAASGWCLMNNGWHYFDPSTNLTVLGNSQGWKKVTASYKGKQTSPNGQITQSVNIKAGTHHFTKYGVVAIKCWRKIDNMSFYFGADGIQYTGWHRMSAGWYYFSKNGTYKGWHKIGKTVKVTDKNPSTGKKETITVAAGSHYFTSKGVYVYNKWYTVNGCKFFFKNNGLQALGWWKLGSRTYYITKKKGALKGRQKISGKEYYFNADGVMQTGWHNINGSWYYFDSKGVMKKNTSVNGVWLGSSGRAQSSGSEFSMMMKAQGLSSPTNYLILVNRSTHRVGIFRGGKGHWSEVKYFACGDGKYSTPTVEGTFYRGIRMLYFDSGSARCWYATQIWGNYLFHSVLYSQESYPRTIIDGTLGAGVSHGCVRLQVDNARWIYNNIPSNTKIVIYH